MTKEELRQKAAIAAMQGMLSGSGPGLVGKAYMMENWAKSASKRGKAFCKIVCEYAVNYADLLVDELDKREGNNGKGEDSTCV